MPVNLARTADSASPSCSAATPLRSLFRALKQERLIFANPTRAISVTYIDGPALPLPSDHLAGLLDDVQPVSSKLLVAFLAIHALTSRDIRLLRLADVDLPRARITLHRTPAPHTIFLDPLTYQLLTAWLHERQRRWPFTQNPYLIINLHTAVDDRCPPIASEAVRDRLRPTGLLPSRLRTDRILHEAAVTADPVHLIRLFGISVKTAMRHIRSAHPERGSVIPR